MGDRGEGETDVARFWVSSFRYRKNCFLLLFHFERLSFWWHLYADERFENAPHPRHCSPLHRSVLGYNNFMLSPATLFVLLRLP